MTVLVTGGLGFVGRHIVDQLVEARTEVVSYNRDFSEHSSPLVKSVQGELFDTRALVEVLNSNDVTSIIHTAAMSHPGISIDLPVTTFSANVDGTLKLFEAARMAGVARIVNFSSECAYGDQPASMAVVESACPMPNTPYGVTKVATEHLGRVYSDLYGLDVLSLRVSEVYGPGLRMPEILKDMLAAAIARERFELSEGGEHRFQFIRVEDVARAAILAAQTGSSKQRVYNVTGGTQVTLRELADLIRRKFPDAQLDIGPGYWTGWDQQGPFDITSAERDFGYVPTWTLDNGIDNYAQWMRDQEMNG